MRSQEDQARFIAEALKQPDNGWVDPYEFRIPGDVVRVGIDRNVDRRMPAAIEWHFQSSKDAVKKFDDLYNAHPDVKTARDISDSFWPPRPIPYAARMEAYRLNNSATRDVADALGLEGRPSLYGRVEPLSTSETARLIRRVGAVIKADATTVGPRSYRWHPIGGPDGSRGKLYRTMTADLPGYKFSKRDKFGDPGAVRQPGAPAPTGDFATWPGQNRPINDLPILGTIPAAAVGAGALALQPEDAEAGPRMTPEQIAALKRSIKAQTVNDNRTDDLQSLRASLGVQKGPDLRVVSGTAAGLAPGAADAFNRNLDASLDLASFFDPSMGYATETARALKDLPGKVGGAGTLALAPVVGATNMLGNIGQLPEAAVGGYDALKRTLKQMKVDAERRKGTDIKSYR
jgi:hypothetical protein